MTRGTNARALSRERYGQFASAYVTSTTHARAPELERLVELAQPEPDWLLLDVATGGGHTALLFAPRVESVVAIDLTPRMLDEARAFVAKQGVERITFANADAEVLPFADGTFDMVTCRIAAHHFPDAARFVGEGVRVLRGPDGIRHRSGGLLLIQDHLLPDDGEAALYIDGFERLRDPSHHRAFSRSEWVDMLEAAGLEVEHAERVPKRHDLGGWAARQGATLEVMERLVVMVEQAPPAAKEWLQPLEWGTAKASFANDHILIAGRKKR